jgi:hypothetical protein
MSTSRAPQKKARRTLLALVAVFTLPLVFAWALTMGPFDWRPANTVNYGVLVEPPLQLKSYGVMDGTGAAPIIRAIPGDWFLVVLRGIVSAESQHWVQMAERIHIAVGRDMPRVTLAMLGLEFDGAAPRWQSWRLPVDTKLFGALSGATGGTVLDTVLLIVDHQGRVVLRYPPDEDGHGALDDLKRLLRASAPP